MATLSREQRRDLENVVKQARRVAEQGARKAVEELAVHHHEPWSSLTLEQRKLRNRLRAHGRQLGDALDRRTDRQDIERLARECAYEHWHRMLFARFLAECDLLIEPKTGVPVTLEECRELALERGTDWLTVASEFAAGMLPQIFRAGDPVLEITVPPETRQELEQLLKSLPGEVFLADDSLGWVYQFWQAERKQQVNDSGVKIGADELPAVTQLFTEDYMVLFLLHNTLGAWWTAKRKAEGKDPNLPGYEWTYLRLKEDGTPAAGAFEGWPRAAKEIKVLDPCMGSGHFLVFALPILVGFRMEEEGLTREQAVEAVLGDNLFGLEIDPRCTQIAAFNLAVAAWRMVGYKPLPSLNLACSGLGINAKEEDWLRLAGSDSRLREAMKRLYAMFEQAPILGSLIDPGRIGGDLFQAEFKEVRPLLEEALASEQRDENANELAVAARGVVAAARILSTKFTIVVTNVPYLGRGRQDDSLAEDCHRFHRDAEADLATCVLNRCLGFAREHGCVALVTKQEPLFQTTYVDFRIRLLRSLQWNFVARLGARAFEGITGERVNVALVGFTVLKPGREHQVFGWDVTALSTPTEKADALQRSSHVTVAQRDQLRNPSSRIVFDQAPDIPRLATYASAFQGIKTGDDDRLRRFFTELSHITEAWRPLQTTVKRTVPFGGLSEVVDWSGNGELLARKQGLQAWGRAGVMVSQMQNMPATLYAGGAFDSNGSPIVPFNPAQLAAIWAFCKSAEYSQELRRIDQSLKPTNSSLVQVPFDLKKWERVAGIEYPTGLPKPHTTNPRQWLSSGHPKGSDYPLQVAVARLLAYRWPRQTGSSFIDCPALGLDGLEAYADADGILCLSPVKGEPPAADRLRALLAAAYSEEWSPDKQAELLRGVGYANKSLEDWLRDGFFEQHCELFHQRPFVWHIWDGLRNGFHAVVNYHKLAAPNGEGRRTLEKLIYTYLGDWIDGQRVDQKAGVEGADARLAAAQHLKTELERILEGEPPYDVFVRWKPLAEQPIGWEPDINDGVRLNIRPFMTARPLNGRGKNACILRVTPKIKWDKDRGKEPHRPREDNPWFWSWDQQTQDFRGGKEFDGNRWNDLHYSRAVKQAARLGREG
jgi:hypothetical protein